jgi:hypothetical protein
MAALFIFNFVGNLNFEGSVIRKRQSSPEEKKHSPDQKKTLLDLKKPPFPQPRLPGISKSPFNK